RHRRHVLEKADDRERSAEQFRKWVAIAREYGVDGVIDGAVILAEVLSVRKLFSLDKRAKLDVDELKSLGELVARLIAMRAQLLRLRDVQRSAERAPAALETDAERHERL